MLAVLLMNRMFSRRRHARSKITKPVIKPEKKEPESEIVYCRTCLSTEDLVPIFQDPETELQRTEDLRLVTGLEIKMEDGLSQQICSNCITTINTALHFRRMSKKAEKSLKGMLTKPKKRKHSSRIQKALKKKTKIEKDLDDYDYDVYGDDFQNDQYEDMEDTKIDIKPVKPTKKKRVSIPNMGSYKCTTCNKEFRMKATYKAHMRFHTNYCVCESCGKRCRNNNQLQEHKRARHGLGKIHKCAYCEYSSATKEALTIHERRHTGERPYVCDHCGATFHRRSNLVQHIAIHLPEKNFQCPVCNKGEKSKKLLQVHISKMHRVSRYRYICPICQDTFTRPGNVRHHLMRTHGVPREDQGVIDKVEIQVPEDVNLNKVYADEYHDMQDAILIM